MATTASATKTDLEKNLGADVVIDYRKQAFETALHDYDVVIDTVGGETLDESLWVLKPDGTVISTTGPPDPTLARSPPDTSAPYAPGCATRPPRPVPRTPTRSPETPWCRTQPDLDGSTEEAVAITDSLSLIL